MIVRSPLLLFLSMKVNFNNLDNHFHIAMGILAHGEAVHVADFAPGLAPTVIADQGQLYRQ